MKLSKAGRRCLRKEVLCMKKRFLTVVAAALALSIFSTTAAFAQGWGRTNNKWFYYLDDGSVAKDTWIDTEGGPYWVRNDGVMATSQWVADNDGSWYYVDNEGRRLQSQLFKQDNDLYWLDAEGVMASEEWIQTEDGKWYYFQGDGKAMKNGWKLIGEDYYYFLKSGVMARDALVPGGYRVGPDGKWIQ